MKSLIVLVTLILTTQIAAADYYPLVCKGGGSIVIESSLSQWAVGTNKILAVNLKFARGTVSAGNVGENLLPGQCAWADPSVSI